MKFCLGLLLLLGSISTLQAEEALPAYSLSNTVVHQLPARSNGRHYGDLD